MLTDRGWYLVFCGLDSVDVLSLLKHDFGEVLFLSYSAMVTVWPCLMLMFYVITLNGRVVSARPALGCEGLLFSLSHVSCDFSPASI